MLAQPAVDCRLVAQINGVASDGQKLAVLARKPAHQRRAHHPAVPGDENRRPFSGKIVVGMSSISSSERRASHRIGKPGLVHGQFAPREVDVVGHHHAN